MYKAITVSSKVLGTAKRAVDMMIIFDFLQLIKVTIFLKKLIFLQKQYLHIYKCHKKWVIKFFYLSKYQKIYRLLLKFQFLFYICKNRYSKYICLGIKSLEKFVKRQFGWGSGAYGLFIATFKNLNHKMGLLFISHNNINV